MTARSSKLLILLSLAFSLASCQKPISSSLEPQDSSFESSKELYLEMPEDTNLEFWITQPVSNEQMQEAGCTYLPGWFGASEWLDSRYEADKSESMVKAPEIHVTYLITGYPDTIDAPTVTHIEITDPCINVYGLTMLSSAEEVDQRMASIATSVNRVEGHRPTYKVGRCSFYFSENGIDIRVPVTNNSGVVY